MTDASLMVPNLDKAVVAINADARGQEPKFKFTVFTEFARRLPARVLGIRLSPVFLKSR